ncbi:secreted effector protein PipB2 [uncultured Gammaproteobacteria bacterium]
MPLPPRICPNCFAESWLGTACTSCHYLQGQEPLDMVLVPGSTLAGGRYYIGRLLGQGGFGATYLGWDDKLSAKVAIKEFLPFGCVTRDVQGSQGSNVRVLSGNQEAFTFGLERFVNEARALARFRSVPNVVSVFDFFEENNTGYIVMEFLQGATLKDMHRSQPNKRMTYDRTVPILRGVLAALAEVHAQSMLHRDISPDNIIITERGIAKLVDFGAARAALSQQAQKMSVILKPGYAPFEQYMETGNHGPWTDIYAVGATFLHVLTGVKPPDALQRLQKDELKPPSAIEVMVPQVLEAALMRAVAVQPEARWRSVAEFSAAMFPAARAQPQAAPAAPAAPVAPVTPAAQSPAALAAASRTIARSPLALSGGDRTLSAFATPRAKMLNNYDDAIDGVPVSTLELQRTLQEHLRFLTGKPNGRRLNLSMRKLSGMTLSGVNLASADLHGAIMIGCTLTGANLSGANLFCTDLRDANLERCNLSKADLRGVKADNANLSGANLDGADCRDGVLFFHREGGDLVDVQEQRESRSASFSGANLAGASFREAELAKVNFARANLQAVKFEKANLANAKFNQAQLADSVFAGANLNDADFTVADLTGVDLSQPEFAQAKIVRRLEEIDKPLRDRILEHQQWVVSLSREGRRLVLKDCDLRGLQMKGVDWSAAELLNVDLRDIVLTRAKLSMTTFTRSRMTHADLTLAEARGANFSQCLLTGARLVDADFSPVVSVQNQANKWFTQFVDADLSGADLSGCRCPEAKFIRANLAGAVLRSANLRGADLSGANLRGADLTGCDLTGATVAKADFTGAIGR